ncbi:hypothetical protein Y032_0032g2577 [Ancylostoma ceylanicum]|nr:hypothetical protein Y032_0032g2577 [Ancylostoma ceylanicum]
MVYKALVEKTRQEIGTNNVDAVYIEAVCGHTNQRVLSLYNYDKNLNFKASRQVKIYVDESYGGKLKRLYDFGPHCSKR